MLKPKLIAPPAPRTGAALIYGLRPGFTEYEPTRADQPRDSVAASCELPSAPLDAPIYSPAGSTRRNTYFEQNATSPALYLMTNNIRSRP